MGDEEFSDSVSYIIQYLFNHWMRPITHEMMVNYNRLMMEWENSWEHPWHRYEDEDEDEFEN